MEKEKKKFSWTQNAVTYSIATILLLFGGQILGGIIVGMVAGIMIIIKDPSVISMMLGGSIDSDLLLSMMGPVALTCTNYLLPLGMWLVCLLWFLFPKNRPIYQTIGKKLTGNNWPKFLLGILLGFGMNAACIFVAYLHGDIELSLANVNPFAMILIYLCVFVQSSSEEILCRGYLFEKILHRHNFILAALVSSGLFAAGHLMNDGVTILSILNIFLFGLFAVFCVYYLDSMWMAFMVHTTWNYTQNILFGLPNSGAKSMYSLFVLNQATARESFAYDPGFGIEGTLLCDIVLLIGCFVIWFFFRGNEHTNIWTELDEEEARKAEQEAQMQVAEQYYQQMQGQPQVPQQVQAVQPQVPQQVQAVQPQAPRQPVQPVQAVQSVQPMTENLAEDPEKDLPDDSSDESGQE